jgi:tetratricopeptide (TPR) repeat protein
MLDGIPLAIELAAARLRVLTLPQMVERLRDPFAVLVRTGPTRDRQATLEATIDWSWDLLDEGERDALAQLTVFVGGFTLAAAEAVLDVGTPAIDVVARLVDKSMLRELQGDRFGMWVTVQEYVDRRRAAPAATRVRHGRHFATLGNDDAMAALGGRDEATVRRALDAELDNLIAASRHAVDRDDSDVAFRTARAAISVLRYRGPLAPALSLARSVLALSSLTSRARARTELMHGTLLAMSRGPEAEAAFARALDHAREAGDLSAEAEALRALAIVVSSQSARFAERRAYQERALQITREIGDRSLEAYVLDCIGSSQWQQGDLDAARGTFELALSVARAHGGAPRLESGLLNNLGVIHLDQGRYVDAGRSFNAALAFAKLVGDAATEGESLANLGGLSFAQGRTAEARSFYLQALDIHRRLGQRYWEVLWIHEIARTELEDDRTADARAGFEQSLAIGRELGDGTVEGRALGELAEIARRHGELDAAMALVTEGERFLRQMMAALDVAKILCTKARVARDREEHELARAALDEATALADAGGCGPSSEVRQRIARTEAAVAPGFRLVQE